MALRRWQAECLNILLRKYLNGQSNCLVTATPGAGKTYLTAALSKQLLDLKLIDFVICIAPSIIVAEGFRVELAAHTGKRMDGRIGSAGESRTYHSLTHLDEQFWTMLNDYRVLIVFDEIHHCGGTDIATCNAWGLTLLKYVKDRATYTLSLSGTPWRSDQLPITLSQYCNEIGTLNSDYTYSLADAIKEEVCRVPQITTIDNSDLYYESSEGNCQHFDNIETLLDTGVPFQQVLENDVLTTHLLGCGVRRLSDLKSTNPRAAGLIVASNIEHAYHLASLLKDHYNEDAVVITSDDKCSSETLARFKDGKQSWVVSVAMISEGTNIPRLQVCCYLSRVKTELYFRQVLGRVLRFTKEGPAFAYFYMLAEPNLIKFARRADDDIPNENIIINHEENHLGSPNHPLQFLEQDNLPDESKERLIENFGDSIQQDSVSDQERNEQTGCLKLVSSSNLSIYGNFLEQLIKLEGPLS